MQWGPTPGKTLWCKRVTWDRAPVNPTGCSGTGGIQLSCPKLKQEAYAIAHPSKGRRYELGLILSAEDNSRRETQLEAIVSHHCRRDSGLSSERGSGQCNTVATMLGFTCLCGCQTLATEPAARHGRNVEITGSTRSPNRNPGSER